MMMLVFVSVLESVRSSCRQQVAAYSRSHLRRSVFIPVHHFYSRRHQTSVCSTIEAVSVHASQLRSNYCVHNIVGRLVF